MGDRFWDYFGFRSLKLILELAASGALDSQSIVYLMLAVALMLGMARGLGEFARF